MSSGFVNRGWVLASFTTCFASRWSKDVPGWDAMPCST
jgi:hypothetical protein